jgi:hypothetical protein
VTVGYFFALIALVGFALIPARLWYIKLPAVIGWVAAWLDGALTTHWSDSAGLTITAASLLFLLFHDRSGTPPRHLGGDTGRRPPNE